MSDNPTKTATLTFDISQDKTELLCALHGQTIALTVWELVTNQIKRWIKDGNHECSTPEDAFQKVRDWLREDLEGRDIDIDSLFQS